MYLKKIFLINLFLSVLGHPCCAWAFSRCNEQGLLLSAGVRVSAAAAPWLWRSGSVVVVHGLSCSVTCGNFQVDQAWNPYLLHCQADSVTEPPGKP